MRPLPTTTRSSFSRRRGTGSNRPARRLLVGAVCAALVIALTGCGNQTAAISEPIQTSSLSDGFPYRLPRGFLQFTVDREKNITTEIVYHPLGPQYNFEYLRSLAASGSYEIHAPAGLLEAVKINQSNEAAQIVADATELIINITNQISVNVAVQAPGGNSDQPGSPQAVPPAVATARLQVDPFAAASAAELQNWLDRELDREGSSFRVSFRQLVGQGTALGLVPIPPQSSDPTECASSICFPVPIIVETLITETREGETFQIHRSLSVIPSPDAVAGYDLTREPCVRTVTSLTFSHGMLTKVSEDQPSALASCLRIPVNVLTALVSVPGDALEAEQTSIELQVQLLDAQRALLNARRALLEAQ